LKDFSLDLSLNSGHLLFGHEDFSLLKITCGYLYGFGGGGGLVKCFFGEGDGAVTGFFG